MTNTTDHNIDKILDDLKFDAALGGADADGKYQFVFTEDGEGEVEALRQLGTAYLSLWQGNSAERRARTQVCNIIQRLAYLAEVKQ